MYLFLGPLRRLDTIFPRAQSLHAQRVLTTHWLNVDHVSFLAAEFAATVSLENQADMKGEKGYLRVGA